MQYVSVGDTAELAPGRMKGSEVEGHEVAKQVALAVDNALAFQEIEALRVKLGLAVEDGAVQHGAVNELFFDGYLTRFHMLDRRSPTIWSSSSDPSRISMPFTSNGLNRMK